MASVKLIIHAFLANVLVLNNPAKMTRMPGNNCQVLCRCDKRVPPGSEGHTCHARSEGHVYRARGSAMDHQRVFRGRDKRVPPNNGPDKQVPPTGQSEGHARRARRIVIDDQTSGRGRDKRVPPSGRLRWNGLAPIAALAKKYSPTVRVTYRRAVPPWAHYVWSEFGLVQSGFIATSRARGHDRFVV